VKKYDERVYRPTIKAATWHCGIAIFNLFRDSFSYIVCYPTVPSDCPSWK